MWKRQQRSRQNEENEKRDEIRKQNNIRTTAFRERQKKVELELNGHLTNSFSNRTMKHRAVSKLIKSLPKSPQKRTEVVSAYLQRNSPIVKTLVKLKKLPSPELIENLRISDAVIKDVKSVIDSVKHQRSDNARAAVSIICASINGNSVEKLRHTKKLAKKLGLPVRQISGGKAVRHKVLTTEKSSWNLTKRKTRSDKIAMLKYTWLQ